MADLPTVVDRLTRAADLVERVVAGRGQHPLAEAEHIAAFDPLTVAALVPLLRHAANGVVRAQYDALTSNEYRLIDDLHTFAARLLREEA